jgi:transposase
MDTSILRVETSQRKVLLKLYRKSPDPAVRLRAHIVLLLAEGYPWTMITAVLFCSTATIARWKQRFEEGSTDALAEESRGRPARLGPWWIWIVLSWVLSKTPRDFGFLRSRWCYEVIVLLLLSLCHVHVSRETIRRQLHEYRCVWRRPRPVLGREDPDYGPKIQALRDLLAHLPADEIALFEDEVDLQTNPKIGAMWMLRGQQAEVATPGDNEKCYLAGSLNWRTGQLLGTVGPNRNGPLFVAHLDDLRRYRKIHVICDNAKFHDSKLVQQHLHQWNGRIELHWLPKRAPKANPIERIWWHLHEEITFTLP